MSEEIKKRTCLICGKKLLDEKLPICLRCKLKGRNAAAKVTEVMGAVVVAVGGVATMKNNQDDGNNCV